MSSYQMKPMTGSLFQEVTKADPKHADWKGSIKMADETEYWANAFEKKKDGKSFLSFTLQKKGTKYEKGATPPEVNMGTLGANPNKKETKHPDRKGRVNVEGKDYWVSAWDNKTAAGKVYLRLTLSVMEAKQAPTQNDDAWKQPPSDDATGGLDIGVPPDFDDGPPF